MSLQEFYEQGFLQEINRQMLHPLGLALSIEFDNDDNAVRFGDPEGLIFGDGVLASDSFRLKKENILKLQKEAEVTRDAALGYYIQ